MLALASIGEDVSKAIAAGRIGRAVAVRLFASLSADHGQLLAATAAALELADRWLAGKLVRIDVRGTVAAGHLTVLAEFADGQTALVGTAQLTSGPPRLEFLIVGTTGTIQYDGANAFDEPVSFDPETARPLATMIENALRTKAPVSR
jgi:hypothetical protein